MLYRVLTEGLFNCVAYKAYGAVISKEDWIGRRLVAECLGFARACGYRRVTLWTNDVLVAARAIYQQAGFRLVASQPHRDFGPPMVGEDWALTLH